MLADVFHSFQSYSFVHLSVMAAIAGVSYALITLRRARPEPAARRMLDRQIGLAGGGVWVISQIIEMLPANFDVTRSLPVHICDVAGVIAPLAILTGYRPLRAMLYFWALALCSQAVFQPELDGGLADITFWVFWMPHGMILSLAIYDLLARGFRPGWRDFGIALATLTIYALLILPLDLAFGLNYGYVGKIDGGPLDFLGPWPVRVFKVFTAVIAVFAVMTWPFTLRRGKGATSGKTS